MLNGEKQAFDEFYGHTKETVEKVCAYFLGEDPAMVQAAVGAYHHAFEQIKAKKKPELPPKAWMSVLAVRECFPVIAKYRDDFDAQSQAMELMASQIPALQEISQDPKERVGFMVRGEVEDLPDPHREFLSFYELQGLSFLEIAKRLGQSWSTVVTKLHAGRQALVRKVKEQFGV